MNLRFGKKYLHDLFWHSILRKGTLLHTELNGANLLGVILGDRVPILCNVEKICPFLPLIVEVGKVSHQSSFP